MTEHKLILTIEKMLEMIGISDDQYEKRMTDKKKTVGVATKTNIKKVINEIKTKTQQHFGYDFSEVENFDDKHIHENLNDFMKRQIPRPEGIEIGFVRRGRKRRKTDCK